MTVEHRSTTPSQPSVVVTADAEGRYCKLVRLAAPLVDALDCLRPYNEFAHLQTYRGAAEAVAQLLEERAQVRRAWAEMEARDCTIWRLQNEKEALRWQAECPVRL